MDVVLVTEILILCFAACLSINVPPGLEVRCPSPYRVQVADGKVVQLEVIDNKTECDRFKRKGYTKRVENVDVKPYINLIFSDGEYRANISWDFSLSRERLPRKFLINFTFYDIEDSEHPRYLTDTCVLLRLIGNRQMKTKDRVQFYFDCLPLLAEPDIGLVVQLWSYSKQGSVCRSQRSLPEKNDLCGPDVQCSREYSFPISKNAHSYRQCVCYIKQHGEPKLNWHYDYTAERFNINFTNMPPNLQYADIEIVDALTEDRLVEDINVQMYSMNNGEIRVKSKQFGPGRYTVYVCVKLKLYMVCSEPGNMEAVYKNEIDDDCGGNDNYFMYSNQKLNVSSRKPEKIISDEPGIQDEKQLQTLLGIVGGLMLTVIATTVTFIVCRRVKQRERLSSSRRDVIEMSEVNHELQPLNIESQLSQHVQTNNGNVETQLCQTQTCEQDTPHLQSNRTNGKDLDAEFYRPQMLPEEFVQEFNNRKTDGDINHEEMSVSQQLRPRPSHSEISQIRDIIQTSKTFEKKRIQVMLLYRSDSDNPMHIQRVKEFKRTLTDKFGIVIEEHKAGNLFDFAESSFVKFFNVVLIISDGLYNVCHQYARSGQLPERDQEKIPCIVLNQMKSFIQTSSEGQHFSKQTVMFLHIVALDNERNYDSLLRKFLNDHPFLIRGNNFKFYNFSGEYFNSEDITSLVKSFKPTEETGMSKDLQRKMCAINADGEL